jgi:hypothetical protein
MKSKHFLLETDGMRNTIAPIRIFDKPESLKMLTNPLGWKIFQELRVPSCPIDIAKKLGMHEQKVYYYINKFRKNGLIREVKSEPRHGTTARFYQLTDFAFGFKTEHISTHHIAMPSPQKMKLLEPFIVDGVLDAKIIVGSPDPHGPWKARASDSCCAIDFALFMGSFTAGEGKPNYKLDTEVREKDLKGNLILIGGPAVNMVVNKLNKKLPVYIDTKNDVKIVSTVSGRSYVNDSCGIINIVENPWNRKSMVLVMAGKRFNGTRSAILAWIKSLDKVVQGNKFNKNAISHVVKGYDLNGDGIIDDSEILE